MPLGTLRNFQFRIIVITSAIICAQAARASQPQSRVPGIQRQLTKGLHLIPVLAKAAYLPAGRQVRQLVFNFQDKTGHLTRLIWIKRGSQLKPAAVRQMIHFNQVSKESLLLLVILLYLTTPISVFVWKILEEVKIGGTIIFQKAFYL
jgi:hypothetical protein